MSAGPRTFPLLVIALSNRGSAVAVMDRPLRLVSISTWERRKERGTHQLARRIKNVCALVKPRSVVVIHATQWRSMPAEMPDWAKPAGAQRTSVAEACEVLACPMTVPAVAACLMDAYPEVEGRLAGVTTATARTDRVRYAQPLLAALIVAHAASVAHLVKYG